MHLNPVVNIKMCISDGGGGATQVSMYDLSRDVPKLRLEGKSLDPFLYQILPKNKTHFYTRASWKFWATAQDDRMRQSYMLHAN